MEPIALRIQWLGNGRKIVELPIPFLSKSDKTGEVICDPVGLFDIENGERLLAIPGIEGVFQLVEKVYLEGADKLMEISETPVVSRETIAQIAVPQPEYYDHTCGCGCGGKLSKKPNHKFTGIPKFLLGHGGFKAKKKAELAVVETPSPAA